MKNKIYTLLDLLKENIYRFFIRKKLKNNNFTIISNDCWGGRVYSDLGLEHNSPTVNMFFYSKCYLKLVSNLKEYLNSEINFTNESIYEVANNNRKLNNNFYPIGVLNDIEIHFLHYRDEEEATEKWNKRVKRVNYNNLFFKFSDAYLIDVNDIFEFDNLEINNKISFTALNYMHLKSNIWIKEFETYKYCLDPYKFKWNYRNNFDIVKWLNIKF